MPFGLCNAPSKFQRVVNDVVGDQLGFLVWVYIDNIIVFSKNAEEHQQHLDLLHKLIQQQQLFPCIDKSTFFKPRVPFSGYIINKNGVHMDAKKIKVIPGWPAPSMGAGGIRLPDKLLRGFQAMLVVLQHHPWSVQMTVYYH